MSVKYETSDATLEIFPNLSDKYAFAEITVPSQGNVRLELIDKDGNILKQFVEEIHAEGIFKYPIDSEYLKEGIYYLRATINGTGITKRLLIDQK